MKILIKLQQNFSEIASFKTLLHFENYSVGLLESPEYKIALKNLATTGAHAYHIHVRTRIFLLGGNKN